MKNVSNLKRRGKQTLPNPRPMRRKVIFPLLEPTHPPDGEKKLAVTGRLAFPNPAPRNHLNGQEVPIFPTPVERMPRRERKRNLNSSDPASRHLNLHVLYHRLTYHLLPRRILPTDPLIPRPENQARNANLSLLVLRQAPTLKLPLSVTVVPCQMVPKPNGSNSMSVLQATGPLPIREHRRLVLGLLARDHTHQLSLHFPPLKRSGELFPRAGLVSKTLWRRSVTLEIEGRI